MNKLQEKVLITFIDVKNNTETIKYLSVYKPYGYIYGIWDNIKHKLIYVGQSIYYHKRGNKYEMIDSYKNYFGSGLLISRALRKNGKERYTKLQIADAKNKQELDELEKYYINYYDTLNINNSDCLNISIGGNIIGRPAGWYHTKEAKEKISKRSKELWNDPRYIEKMSKRSKEVPNSGRFTSESIPWSKGQTKETNPKLKEAGRKISIKLKEYYKNKKN